MSSADKTPAHCRGGSACSPWLAGEQTSSVKQSLGEGVRSGEGHCCAETWQKMGSHHQALPLMLCATTFQTHMRICMTVMPYAIRMLMSFVSAVALRLSACTSNKVA